MVKEDDNFTKKLEKAYSYLKEKNIKKAVSEYNRINNEFNNLNNKPEKLKQDIRLLHNELNLYLKVNECYKNAENGDFRMFDEEMKLMHDFVHEIRNNRNKIELIELKNSDFNLNVFANKLKIDDFNKKHEKLINISDVNKSIFEFANLFVIYNKLFDNLEREDRLIIYSKLKNAYRDISIKNSFAASRKFPKVLYGKTIETPKTINYKNQNNKIPLNTYELINTTDYSKAIEFYENL